MTANTAPTSHESIFIAGEWSHDPTRPWIDIESPVTQKVIGRVPEATPADVDRAVAGAVDLHREGSWRNLDVGERARLLEKIADGIESRADDFGRLYTLDQGGLSSFGSFPPAASAAIFRDNAALAGSLDLGPSRRDTATGSVYILREAVGPVAAIVPWNAPLLLAAAKIAPALLAGCPVVVKVSPETPLVSFVLADIIAEAGLPAGAVSFLPGGRELGQYLISRPGIASISFTGSTPAGQRVMETAAQRMTRVTLELGGKSAALVLDDAEPSEFAPLLAGGCTLQSGQVCTTQSRILIPAAREKEWIDALTDAFTNLTVGNPEEEATAIGPLVSAAQLGRVEGFVERATAEGARVLAGGSRPSGPGFESGYWYLPTLITGTTPDMEINREEVFGPVVTVESYADLDSGIAAVNDTDYGLSNGIFTSDVDRAMTVAPRLESGVVAINSPGPSPTAPFGGYKMSGMGREGGIEGVHEFLEVKQVTLPA